MRNLFPFRRFSLNLLSGILPPYPCSCILRNLDQPQTTFYGYNTQKTFFKVIRSFDVVGFCPCGTNYGDNEIKITINETLLHKDTKVIIDSFKKALKSARG